MPVGRGAVSGGAYGAGQHGGAAHDGPPAGDVDPGGVPVVIGLGLAAGAGGNAALGAVNQRL